MPFISGVFQHGRTMFAFGLFVSVSLVTQLSRAVAETEIAAELIQTQYVSEKALEEQSNQYSNFVPAFRGSGTLRRDFTGKTDAKAIIPMTEEGEFHFVVRDFYLRYAFNEGRMAFTLGRADRLWSQTDSDWNLGLWQPLFRWDYVRPESMGFTGLFFDGKSKNIRVTTFISPFHLPDQQAQFEIENGEVKSGNRWFRAPVANLDIEQGTNRIHYELNKPRTEDVVMNAVYAFSVMAGEEADGWWGRYAFADKPMNQFHLAIETDSSVFLHINSEIRPIIHPKVVRHTLSSYETGYSWDERTKLYAGITTEYIDDPRLPDGWEETELKDAVYLSAGASVGLGFIGISRGQLSLGYVERRESEESGATSIEGDIEASTQRPAFKRLASAGFQYPLYGRQRLSGQFRYTHSFSDDGDWVTAQLNYSPERRMTWYMGLDVFGAPDETHGKRSFISHYRNNDRVFGGVSYVF